MNIPLLILSALLIITIQSIIYKKWGLKSIEYTRYFLEDSVFEGDDVQLVEVVTNNKLLPVPWLRLDSRVDPSLRFQKQSNLDVKHHEFHKSFFSMMPFTKITRRHTVNCSKRGYYEIDSARLTCNDLINVIQLYGDVPLSSSITVYPKIFLIHELGLSSLNWNGDVVVRRWIVDDPFMISGVRDYRYGDPMNRINWSSTARTGKLQVYNADYTSNIKLMILLNMETLDKTWNYSTGNELIEKGISYCASLANYSISQGMETGFACNGSLVDLPKEDVIVPPGCGIGQMKCLLDTMARLDLRNPLQFHYFLDNIIDMGVKDTDYLIITAFENEQINARIKEIRNLGNSVELFYINKE